MRVIVQSLSGEELEFEVESTTTFAGLKLLIEAELQFPPVCQQLLLGADAIPEGSVLADHIDQDDDSLFVTVTNVVPYEGDLHKATLAQDREAIRILMTQRDSEWKDLSNLPDWSGLQEAVMRWGFPEEAVASAMATCRTSKQPVTYRNVMKVIKK